MSELRAAAQRLASEIVAWRRELHRHPELGFEEHRTAAFVADHLRRLGVEEVRTGVARTGVLGIVRAHDASEPPVLLRADMDALPIQEIEGREYGSTVPGRMHACGHDGHTAMLLGAAALLVERREALCRDVVLCFQPAEEGLGGAQQMIRDGVLESTRAASAFAVHLWSPFPAGQLHVRSGPVMAAQDEFLARFVGRGGHGALPHLALDPVVAASFGIVALQTVVSRFADPIRPAVVTVGSLHAGTAPNVIPDDARLHGTMRSFHEDVREILRTRAREALDGAARAVGCTCEFELRPGYPAVVNDEAATAALRSAAIEILGKDNVVEADPLAAAEDFAYFLQRVPGAFALLGAGNAARGIDAPHHSPRFDVDETVLPLGSAIHAAVALSRPDPRRAG